MQGKGSYVDLSAMFQIKWVTLSQLEPLGLVQEPNLSGWKAEMQENNITHNNETLLHTSWHTKNGPYGFTGLWGFKCAWAEFYIWATDMRFCLKLPQGLYYMSGNSKCSGETALMYRLAWACAGSLCVGSYMFLTTELKIITKVVLCVEVSGHGKGIKNSFTSL